MDVREKYVMQKISRKENSICPNCIHHNLCIAENNQPCFECNRFIYAHGVTVQEQDGCEYCKEDNEGFRRMFGAFSLINPFHGKTWQIHAGKCKLMEINFCPMCGRRLPQPPKGE